MRIGTIFGFILSIIIIFSGCSLLTNPDSTDALKLTPDDEKAIYEYLDTKTNDVAPATLPNGKMFSAFDVLGTDKNKIYIWLEKFEYVKIDGKVKQEGDAVLCPLVLNVKKTDKGISIVSHDKTVDGEDNGKSIRRLFPPNVRKKISECGYDDSYKAKLEEIAKARAEKDLKV